MNRWIRLAAPALAALALGAGTAARAAVPAQLQTALVSPAVAATSSTLPAGTRLARSDDALARADASFLKRALQGGQAGIESGRLALRRATSPRLKAFAQQMVDHHTRHSEALQRLALGKGLRDLPTRPSMAQQARLRLLSKADAARFDEHYAEQMGIEAHEDSVELFEKASEDARDPEVRAWAASTLPELRQHLALARELGTTLAKGDDRAPIDGRR